MDNDVVDGWLKFVADCNKDGGYPNSYQAGLDRTALLERWGLECPALEAPEVLWSNANGRYELSGLHVPKQPRKRDQ